MRKFLLLALLGSVLAVFTSSAVQAGELDFLLEALVEKGIVSPIEAAKIKESTEKAVKEDLAAGRSYALPEWVQKMKIKGDFRMRNQYERTTNSAEGRNRARIRLRVGVESTVFENILVAFGLATGSGDPRSSNQTLEDTFNKPDIRLDYAYAEMQKILEHLSVAVGKFPFAKWLWLPTDLAWDTDITTDGFSSLWEGNIIPDLDYWLGGGIWLLDEAGSSLDDPDPFIKYVQGGVKFKAFENKIDGKMAVTFYDPQGLVGLTLANDSETNTGASTSTGLQSNYRAVSPGAEFGIAKPFGGLPFNIDERIAIFGEYIHNLDTGLIGEDISDFTGHAFGIVFGHNKVSYPGAWQLRYIKAKLGKDAWIDALPDSDRAFGGDTDIESHEAIFTLGLKKNVSFGLDYYKSWSMTNRQNKEHIVQADLNFKF